MPYDVGGITLKSVFKNYTGNELEYCPIIFSNTHVIKSKIEEALTNDIPVIVAVYKNSYGVNNFKLYEYDKNAYPNYSKSWQTVSEHYMTLTELRYDDNCEHKVSMVLSSWGEKYIMDFYDFYNTGKEELINEAASCFFIPCF